MLVLLQWKLHSPSVAAVGVAAVAIALAECIAAVGVAVTVDILKV
jgi:hypothetical protein